MKTAFLESLFSQIVRMRNKINKLPIEDKSRLRVVDLHLGKIMIEIEHLLTNIKY